MSFPINLMGVTELLNPSNL